MVTPTSGTPPNTVPSLLSVEVLQRQLVGLRRQRHVADFLDQLGAFGEEELDELLHLGALRGRVAHVDEQRARQRLVVPSFTASMLGPTALPFGLTIGTARILSL